MPHEHEKLRSSRFEVSFGGSASNTAHWLSCLGTKVEMHGCVGDDHFGEICVDALKNVGVDTSKIKIIFEDSTGIAAIFINPESKRMVTTGGANQKLDPNTISIDSLIKGTHIHVAHSQREKLSDLLSTAKLTGASTSCEFNGSNSTSLIKDLDYCFMNYDEFKAGFGNDTPQTIWRSLSGTENSTLVLTQGKKGARIISHSSDIEVRTEAVTAIDRTGGGDSFNAGFLYGIAQSLDNVDAAAVGLLLAKHVILHKGARPSDPDIIENVLAHTRALTIKEES